MQKFNDEEEIKEGKENKSKVIFPKKDPIIWNTCRRSLEQVDKIKIGNYTGKLKEETKAEWINYWQAIKIQIQT